MLQAFPAWPTWIRGMLPGRHGGAVALGHPLEAAAPGVVEGHSLQQGCPRSMLKLWLVLFAQFSHSRLVSIVKLSSGQISGTA